MEAIEDLMVGKEARLYVVVNKTLMNRSLDRDKRYIFTSILEDAFQTACLMHRVAEYVETVAFFQMIGET